MTPVDEMNTALSSLNNLVDTMKATERRAEWFKSQFYLMLKDNNTWVNRKVEDAKELADVPDTVDVNTKEPMLYLCQVEALLKGK